jgi:arylsulfatase A-like enzyme
MRFLLVLLPALFAIAVARAQVGIPVTAPQRPIPAVEHVCIISIDGLRPDRALWADMPNLRALARAGSYSWWARTTAVAVTLPSHVSMLTGVQPSKHGIDWNWDIPLSQPVYPRVPTIFELARQAGYSTALVSGKSKFSFLNKPGTVTHAAIVEENRYPANAEVVADASRIIETHKPQLLFIHFPDVDATGHGRGWGSAEQLAAIEETDRQLGEVLAAMERAGTRASTTLIISADHGGAGRSHGPEDPRSRHIPWIINGPGVQAGFDLTQLGGLEINTEDTAATACHLLGLRIPPYFDGKPILQAFAP